MTDSNLYSNSQQVGQDELCDKLKKAIFDGEGAQNMTGLDHPGDWRERPVPKNPKSVIHLLFQAIKDEPAIVEDVVRLAVSRYFKDNHIKANGLINLEYINYLNQTKFSTLTWLKFELLLSHLIKENVYEPKTMANEVITTTKSELNPGLASKFASAIQGCVKACRQVGGDKDEEFDEKWCEIIDWMSWFLKEDDGDF